ALLRADVCSKLLSSHDLPSACDCRLQAILVSAAGGARLLFQRRTRLCCPCSRSEAPPRTAIADPIPRSEPPLEPGHGRRRKSLWGFIDGLASPFYDYFASSAKHWGELPSLGCGDSCLLVDGCWVGQLLQSL